MMKFKSRSARTKFKFKSKLTARVKFRERAAFSQAVIKRICLAHTATYRKRGSAHTQVPPKSLAARSRVASSNAVVGWIVNLNY